MRLLLLVLLVAMTPIRAVAQSPREVVRTPADSVFINFDATIGAMRAGGPAGGGATVTSETAVTAFLVAPTDEGLQSARITGHTLIDGHTIRFDLTPAQAGLLALSAAAKRRPYILIDRLVLDRKPTTDLLAIVPTEVTFAIAGPVTRTVLLFASYVTSAAAKRIQEQDAADWRVTIGGAEIPVRRVLVVPPDLAPGPGLRYQFQVRLTLTGFIPNDAEVVVHYTAEGSPAPAPPSAPAPKEVAKGRTLAAPGRYAGNPAGDADIYLGFTYTATRGTTAATRHVGGLQAHVERPFSFWGRARRDVFSIVPRFDALVHAKELDDEDSMSLKADVEWQRMLGNLERLPDLDRAPDANPIYNLRTSFGGGLEFSKGFREHNAIAEARVAPALHVFGTAYAKPRTLEGIRLMVAPAAGFELGRVIDSQLDALIASRVTRLKGGADAQLRFAFRDAPYADAVVIEAGYVGRKLFTREQFADVSRSGADRSTRHYGRLAGKFVFNANFEVFLSYARGSLPPKFERVNKVEAGLAFRYNAGY
jgi:hypothetical protein